jgi:hypothetical protein
MTTFQKQLGRFPLGIWLAYAALGVLCLAWVMQAYSLLDWEGALALGFQNESFSGDPAEQAWALESWGVAMADMVWPMPITLVALFGMTRGRFYGYVAAMMVFAIGVYFPLFFAFQRWATFPSFAVVALVLFTLPCLLGIVGLWANRGRFIG